MTRASKYLANSQGQDLALHCRAVGIVSGALAEVICPPVKMPSKNRDEIVQGARLGAYLHDVGKAHPKFQKFIRDSINGTGRSYDNGHDVDNAIAEEVKYDYYHNQWSLIGMNRKNHMANYGLAAYAVYHHHDSSRNKEIDENMMRQIVIPEAITEFYDEMIYIYERDYGSITNLRFSDCNRPTQYSPLRNDLTITLFCLITADRWVSKMGRALNDADLDLKGAFCPGFQDWLRRSSRFPPQKCSGLLKEQMDVIDKISQSTSNVFSVCGLPGSGKTIVGLAFAHLYNRDKIIFMAPQRSICQSLDRTIEGDLTIIGRNYSRELVLASQVQTAHDANGKDTTQNATDNLESDIIIINIDSTLKSFYDYGRYHCLIDLLIQPMVIDESHLLNRGDNAILALTRSLIATRYALGSKTLLTTATPVNILQGLRGLDHSVVGVLEIEMEYPKHLDAEIEIFVVDSIPKLDSAKSTWIRLPTVKNVQAQMTQLEPNKFNTCFHANCDSRDIDKKIDHIYNTNGRSPNHQLGKNVTCSTSIAEVSFNFSFEVAILACSSPESEMQAVGRVNRFGEERHAKVYVLCQEFKGGRNVTEINYDINLHYAWREFLTKEIGPSGVKMRRSEFFKLQRRFNANNEKGIEKWINRSISSSEEEVLNLKTTKSGPKNRGDNNPVCANGGLRKTKSFFANFIINGHHKVVQISGDKLETVKRYIGVAETPLQLYNRLCASEIDIEINPNYSPRRAFLYRGKWQPSDKILNKAREYNSALLMQHKDDKKGISQHYCFYYDDDPNVLTNLGLIEDENND